MRSRPFLLGLTGSVGMGKSTTAGFFAEAGVPVWDADAAVHRLYGPGGAGTAAIAAILPAATGPEGVDRAVLRQAALAHPDLLARIEAAIHPLVAADRAAFLAAHPDAELLVFDVPLLFETGAQAEFDAVLVVTALPEVQRARVRTRPGMTEAAFQRLLERQMPDAEKRARATYVIDTAQGLEAARTAVLDLIDTIRRDRP